MATPECNATCDIVILVPLASTVRNAPVNSASRVRPIALPARLCVPMVCTGAADAMATEDLEPRKSVSNNGSATSLITATLPAEVT